MSNCVRKLTHTGKKKNKFAYPQGYPPFSWLKRFFSYSFYLSLAFIFFVSIWIIISDRVIKVHLSFSFIFKRSNLGMNFTVPNLRCETKSSLDRCWKTCKIKIIINWIFYRLRYYAFFFPFLYLRFFISYFSHYFYHINENVFRFCFEFLYCKLSAFFIPYLLVGQQFPPNNEWFYIPAKYTLIFINILFLIKVINRHTIM